MTAQSWNEEIINYCDTLADTVSAKTAQSIYVSEAKRKKFPKYNRCFDREHEITFVEGSRGFQAADAFPGRTEKPYHTFYIKNWNTIPIDISLNYRSWSDDPDYHEILEKNHKVSFTFKEPLVLNPLEEVLIKVHGGLLNSVAENWLPCHQFYNTRIRQHVNRFIFQGNEALESCSNDLDDQSYCKCCLEKEGIANLNTNLAIAQKTNMSFHYDFTWTKNIEEIFKCCPNHDVEYFSEATKGLRPYIKNNVCSYDSWRENLPKDEFALNVSFKRYK